MHEYQMEEMVERLIAANLLPADFHTNAVEVLRGYWSGKLADTWSTDDVLSLDEQNQYNLTEDDAQAILELTQRNKDASIGINWDVIMGHLIDHVHERDRRTAGLA